MSSSSAGYLDPGVTWGGGVGGAMNLANNKNIFKRSYGTMWRMLIVFADHNCYDQI